MKVPQSAHLSARLSVVCAWTSTQTKLARRSEPIIVFDESEQQLLQELSEIEDRCHSVLTDSASKQS